MALRFQWYCAKGKGGQCRFLHITELQFPERAVETFRQEISRFFGLYTAGSGRGDGLASVRRPRPIDTLPANHAAGRSDHPSHGLLQDAAGRPVSGPRTGE
jgi:hypothetical protein